MRFVTASGSAAGEATRSGGLIVIVKFVVFVAIPSVTVRLNAHVAVAGAVTDTLGVPVSALVTGSVEEALMAVNPTQFAAPSPVLVNVSVPVPGAAAVPALTPPVSVYVRPGAPPDESVSVTPGPAAVIVACVVVTTAWLLIVIVEFDVAIPAGTAVFPVSWIVTETATPLPAVVGVPVTWHVGGAVELGAAGTVSPTVANPVFVQE